MEYETGDSPSATPSSPADPTAESAGPTSRPDLVVVASGTLFPLVEDLSGLWNATPTRSESDRWPAGGVDPGGAGLANDRPDGGCDRRQIWWASQDDAVRRRP